MAPQDNIQIYIDGEPITVKHRRLTGAQLVALVTPPADHVWLDIADAQDESIAPTEVVAIEENIRFYTDRPRTIYIDKIPYQVRTAVLTETQLRDLPTPPIADDYGIWKDIPDDLDDPIKAGEIVHIVDGDRFFTKALPKRELHVIVNRKHTVTLHGARQTGMSIKEAAIAQDVPIQLDFLLSRKTSAKFDQVGDDEQIRVHDGDEFRAVDGDDNS
ncbi:multiubiquitin domain-containing protein (plasmid) [Mycolicibacterium crocinum]|uniref:Multi-ubiquitin domain-containing protein n=2 Tax=Mycolicibacterium TaxID=1866885 RepID=A0A064C911_9MYCO|nr:MULTISPECIES: multiubiquitin domain-containing protein [Mycolicibacterium]KDE96780.1 hypothetical protein Y900_029525 [Mycolicibacterium aromaticivorans JS19b1 = JCM 16368]ULN44817.1 multiubiquitin domain-containing protein [Mycolicibacterium crocinum]